MKKPMSMSAKMRRMIEQGHSNKAIIEKLGVKPQAVYNMRYQLNKARGLGAIGKPAPAPTAGIGAPPRNTNKVKAGELASLPPTPPAPPTPPMPEPDYMPITMVEPKPTLWQRIVRFFKGN